jgi:chemotaxis protein methyltransferase CheR
MVRNLSRFSPLATATPQNIEDEELNLLLQRVYDVHGYDFRQYARGSLKRRVAEIIAREGLRNVSELQGRVLRDSELFHGLVCDLTVQVSSFFRDSDFFQAFRRRAVPILRTYPSIRIWHAGCATGEEAYSLAMILSEEGLLHKCRFYATDINSQSLERAALGAYSIGEVGEADRSYRESGGALSLWEYFQPAPGGVQIVPDLKDRITFFQHNLATDGSFNDFHVIVCRNVLIYFSRPLQDRVHELFYNSFVRFGILGLGANETIDLTPKSHKYRPLDENSWLYRRIE